MEQIILNVFAISLGTAIIVFAISTIVILPIFFLVLSKYDKKSFSHYCFAYFFPIPNPVSIFSFILYVMKTNFKKFDSKSLNFLANLVRLTWIHPLIYSFLAFLFIYIIDAIFGRNIFDQFFK